jgi:hypothetical protein
MKSYKLRDQLQPLFVADLDLFDFLKHLEDNLCNRRNADTFFQNVDLFKSVLASSTLLVSCICDP